MKVRVDHTQLMIGSLNEVIGQRFRIQSGVSGKHCIDTSNDALAEMIRTKFRTGSNYDYFYNGVECGEFKEDGLFRTNLEPPYAIEISNKTEFMEFLKKL